MKIGLILLNFLLACGVVYEVCGLFTKDGKVQYVAKARTVKSGDASATKQATTPKKNKMSNNEASQILLASNIFDVSRCPEAVNSRGGGSAQMALLGIYQVGDCRGAIIQQKRNSNNRRPPWIRNNNNTSQQSTPPLKQFLRVGESLENGYVLKEIGEDSVTLSRGGGRLELTLETASKNSPSALAAAAAASKQNRPSTQEMQQMMMVRGMRVMEQLVRQNSQQNNNQGNNRPTAPGRNNNSGNNNNGGSNRTMRNNR